MANQDVFPTNSRTENFLDICSTSGHDRKYFLFFRYIKTRNPDMFFEQSEYAEFNEDILNFRLWLPALPVCRKHYENVISTLFLNKTSPLNTMKIFSASGYDGKYFWFLKNLQKLYLICLIISYIMKGKSRTNFSLCRISS